jgi:hypothetical protein
MYVTYNVTYYILLHITFSYMQMENGQTLLLLNIVGLNHKLSQQMNLAIE